MTFRSEYSGEILVFARLGSCIVHGIALLMNIGVGFYGTYTIKSLAVSVIYLSGLIILDLVMLVTCSYKEIRGFVSLWGALLVLSGVMVLLPKAGVSMEWLLLSALVLPLCFIQLLYGLWLLRQNRRIS